MRDILQILLGVVFAVLGTSFLFGVLVGMVFSSVGARTGRRGVALPLKQEPKVGWAQGTPSRGKAH